MRVRDLLNSLGDCLDVTYSIHWDYDDADQTDSYIESDDKYSILDIVGAYNILPEDAIYVAPSPDKTKIVLTLYIESPNKHKK